MEVPKTTETPEPELRRLAHLLRNHLFTISLGLKSLELTRNDPDRFATVLEQVRKNGFAGLEEVADALDALAQS